MRFQKVREVVCSAASGLMLAGCAVTATAQDATPLEAFFLGKQVVVKVDMPGSQQGIDLKFDKITPLDWNSYSSRVKSYGVAIHQGQTARVTKFVVKKDTIEFQLDGGGFGTAGDDTSTTVSVPSTPKSQYEKDLEKQASNTTDAERKRNLQRDLDHERNRRERIDSKNQADAAVASQMKAQQVMDRRMHGGPRFNLRFKDTIPSDDRSPDAIMRLLAAYVDFGGVQRNGPMGNAPVQGAYPPQQGGYAPQPGPPMPADPGPGASIDQLRKGMRIDEVTRLFGQGRRVSESVGNDGMHTQVLQYQIGNSTASVTYVEGVIVRYSVSYN